MESELCQSRGMRVPATYESIQHEERWYNNAVSFCVNRASEQLAP